MKEVYLNKQKNRETKYKGEFEKVFPANCGQSCLLKSKTRMGH